MKTSRMFAALLTLLIMEGAPAFAQSKRIAKPSAKAVKMVAYDAKDKRYYSVAWAKAHGMKDKGGDRLILIPMAKLPRGAKMSRAMRGKM